MFATNMSEEVVDNDSLRGNSWYRTVWKLRTAGGADSVSINIDIYLSHGLTSCTIPGNSSRTSFLSFHFVSHYYDGVICQKSGGERWRGALAPLVPLLSTPLMSVR